MSFGRGGGESEGGLRGQFERLASTKAELLVLVLARQSEIQQFAAKVTSGDDSAQLEIPSEIGELALGVAAFRANNQGSLDSEYIIPEIVQPLVNSCGSKQRAIKLMRTAGKEVARSQ